MSIALIDYGCHSFTYRLAAKLRQKGFPVEYLVNGSLESPNLTSLESWIAESPKMVRAITCARPYGKMGLRKRLAGELEWGRNCVARLEETRPDTVVVSCVPLTAVAAIHHWARTHSARFVYWLQDIQGRAIHDLLGRKLGIPGRTLGAVASLWEQELMENSQMVITITSGHEDELPPLIRQTGRHALLENWANIEDIPQYPPDNDWSSSHHLNHTTNIVYSGTLGMKHDLRMFLKLADHFQYRPEIRIVIVSSGQAADKLRQDAAELKLPNLVVLPFQQYTELPKVLASAAVLIAPLGSEAGSFCVPSKILAYLCAGRPTVIAIDKSNAAAQIIQRARAGSVIPPGHSDSFITAVEAFVNDHDLRLSTGSAARAYAEVTFGIEHVVTKFIDILQRASSALQPPPLTRAASHS